MFKKRVAIQGEKASFHDIAAKQFFGPDIKVVEGDTFPQLFKAVSSDSADYAVCAIENTLYGSINETYDLLIRNNFVISGEIYLRIAHCLIGQPGAKLSDIKEVYSHPIALAQCEEYLDQKLPGAKRLELHDTAASVEKIKKLGTKSSAAIASREAADLHGMKIIASEIETNKENFTRFVVLESSPSKLTARRVNNKTSLIIKTSHQPGALYRALGTFAKKSINLTKLESRPIVGKAWQYIFYVDVEVGENDPNFKQALKLLDKQDCTVRILGSYLAGTKPATT